MTTLQQQFEKDFPNKSVRKISICRKYENSNFTNYDLDLSGYVRLKILSLGENKITSIKLGECKDLANLGFENNNLTSIDFLNCLPNPKKLDAVYAYNN